MKKVQNKLMLATQHAEKNTNGTKEAILSDNTRNIVIRHLNSFRNNDLGAVMSDYTNQSVLITQVATYTGLNEIAAFFADLVTHFPKQSSIFELDKMVVKDSLVFIVWHATTPSLDVPLGSDSFIIKDGKIYQQTFVGQLNFIH